VLRTLALALLARQQQAPAQAVVRLLLKETSLTLQPLECRHSEHGLLVVAPILRIFSSSNFVLLGLFGTGATTSAFGQPQQNTTSAFGTTGAFGQNTSQPSAFGSTNTGTGGLFGAKPAGTGGFGTTGSFGGGTTGAFGTNTGAFGNTATTTTPGAFGTGNINLAPHAISC